MLDKQRETDRKILIGDINAKTVNSEHEHVMDKHRLGRVYESWKLLADFCVFNNMAISGSFFSHKDIHMATWRFPDRVTENQINHPCIRQMLRQSIQDVRVKRGGDD